MNPFDMLKKATKMQKEMKKIQKDLKKRTAEAESGGVTVVARGDMTLASVSIDENAIDTSDTRALEKHLTNAANEALAAVQKEAAAAMSSLTGGLGDLNSMLGG